MKKANRTVSLSALLLVTSLCVFWWALATGKPSIGAQEATSEATTPQPVDDDMHHFMEYVFEPNYKRLKATMADEPTDKKTWKAIKGDALTLAECANLLLTRAPDEKGDRWRELSAAVRSRGGELYQAAREADYAAARTAYLNMLYKCNSCHQQFADGEHQLQP